jgi:uridine kinase
MVNLRLFKRGVYMSDKTLVVSISAISGGGKTAVTEELVRLLKNVEVISFDSYRIDFLKQDYCQWSANGADYNEWYLEPIANDILHLIKEKPDIILLDYPFGYRNEVVGKFIDYAVFIDTPLDIALARRIIRDYTQRDKSRRKIENLRDDLDSSLSFYLSRHRETYLQHINTVKPFSDVIIDGCLPINTIASIIIEKIDSLKVKYSSSE